MHRREPFTQLYAHFVWSTWDRLPLITSAVERRLDGAMINKCRDLKYLPIRMGGMADHIHLLVRMHPAVAISTFVKEVKGSSSHLITHEVTPGEFFKWQGAYGAFTLCADDFASRSGEFHSPASLKQIATCSIIPR